MLNKLKIYAGTSECSNRNPKNWASRKVRSKHTYVQKELHGSSHYQNSSAAVTPWAPDSQDLGFALLWIRPGQGQITIKRSAPG